MEQPDSSGDAPPLSAVGLQRQQRRAKRFVERTALLVIAGPVCLALLAFLVFWGLSGSGWSLLGIPLIALAALLSMALPLIVPALFVLGAWALVRAYYKKPPTVSTTTPVAAAAGSSDGGSQPDPSPVPQFAAEVATLEELRGQLAAEARRRTKLFVPLGLGGALLLYIWTTSSGGSARNSSVVAFVVFMVIGGGAAWIWAVMGPSTRYRKAFKDVLIPRLLQAHGELTHSLGTKPDIGRAVALGFLPAYDKLDADDGFAGRYRQHPLAISEIVVARKVGKRTETLFQGLYVEIGIASPFHGTTILRDREGAQPETGLQRVHLEDPVFKDVYAAWSSDQIEARAVLTPAVMERLLVMADGKSFLPPLFLLSGDKMVFALPAVIPHSLFEPPGLETHVAAQQLASLKDDFARVFALADAMIDMHLALRAPPEALPPSVTFPPARTSPS